MISGKPRFKESAVVDGHAIARHNKVLQLLLGIVNNLIKFSPMTAEVCEPLRKLRSVKTE